MAQIHTLPQPVPALPEDAVLSGEAGTLALYHAASAKVAALLEADLASGDAVYSGADIAQLRASIAPLATLPPRGIGTLQALDHVGRAALEHALRIANPAAMAHLHCPVLVSALAAEMLASATNPSLDSWDQSPFATLAEEALCWELARLSGLPSGASGSFTSGGSQSNLTALLLAREKAMPAGLQGEASRPVILCSELAHFTIAKSARVLGLGPEAVVCVPADPAFRMDIPALEAIMTRLKAEGRKVIALVATAGTTDFGSIDPLPELVQLARREGIWLHVDAAFGGGALLSNHHAHLLEGLGEADSIALDFHKMLFQPVACGVLLLRDPQDFAPLAMHADYLNPEESLFEGAPDLVERSLQTTRRFECTQSDDVVSGAGASRLRRTGGCGDSQCRRGGRTSGPSGGFHAGRARRAQHRCVSLSRCRHLG